MLGKIRDIILKTDQILYKKFGSDKSLKILENIKEARIIFSYLNEIGEESKVRFVGGCIRKALTGQRIDDIDLATSLTPDEIKKKLNKENIKIIDTGISHGTLTVILNNKKFEITTLRKDISTDGRHANIEFTSNWEQDALRRDFTINAIYADIEGRIFDPFDGISDLRNGKIKFIGQAKERIQEDYLRILRYFRFYTQYSKEDHDKETIQPIKQYINGLNNISKERIFDELKKILGLKNIYTLFSNKDSVEIILNIFPQFKYHERLKKINYLADSLKEKYDKYLILALLILDETNDYEYFCHKYKTSNNLKNRLKTISEKLPNFKNKKFYHKENIKKLIYLTSKENVKDFLLFSACLKTKVSNIEELIEYLNVCKVPKFPITGDYLIGHGYKTGKMLGQKLKFLEEKWIENNFIIEKKVIEKSFDKDNKY